jgi:succinate dehydrogenase/fumarate reductase flavoprotein subunit
MGGIRVDTTMSTGIPGLFAAGEAVGGANGANRLSGNAITEALAFGRMAGRSAAAWHRGPAFDPGAAAESMALAEAQGPDLNTASLFARLQDVMADRDGPFRSAAGLTQARQAVETLRSAMGTVPPGRPRPHDLARADWFDLRQALLVADCVITAAAARTESRGAHQREDHPAMEDGWQCNQILTLKDGSLDLERRAVPS